MRSIPACAGEPNDLRERHPLRAVYPRVCGGTLRRERRSAGRWGLSPRVRGNRSDCVQWWPSAWSIPACAGEPQTLCGGMYCHRVYPRVCGGTAGAPALLKRGPGLSPRVRGNLGIDVVDRAAAGSIPACAGEPELRSHKSAAPAVYPRVCGGTRYIRRDPAAALGLSPRVRGNLVDLGENGRRRGSIPACAGEPDPLHRYRRGNQVYPRVCGGTQISCGTKPHSKGLSPRVRGNPWRRLTRSSCPGSIPACAGEPNSPPNPASLNAVYPRVCGGTQGILGRVLAADGLSPRVRGNPAPAFRASYSKRSIPACAGEPRPTATAGAYCGVYPRVCGGTVISVGNRAESGGLSPRVRGNQYPLRQMAAVERSIPACAGEPIPGQPEQPGQGVYPRVCGGTALPASKRYPSPGLSPRVRGNQVRLLLSRIHLGSIPACAGEPDESAVGPPPQQGLSPRVRGNLDTLPGDVAIYGSIPACAGEPWCGNAGGICARVYPRVCGGTERYHRLLAPVQGLSPRVRGNPIRPPVRLMNFGSIPACAGEPCS